MIDNNKLSDEKFESLRIDYNDNLYNYMMKYIIPDVIAFQLSNSYYRGFINNTTLLQQFNSMRDIFNILPNLDDMEDIIKEQLNIKYNLNIISDNPLVIKKWK